MTFGFPPSDIRFSSVRVNIISLRQRRNITFATGKNITPSTARHIAWFTLCYNIISASRIVNAHRFHIVPFRRTVTKSNDNFREKIAVAFLFFPLSCLLFYLLFVMLSAFLIYIRRRNCRLKIRRREPTVFISPSLRLKLVSVLMKILYHSFSSF